MIQKIVQCHNPLLSLRLSAHLVCLLQFRASLDFSRVPYTAAKPQLHNFRGECVKSIQTAETAPEKKNYPVRLKNCPRKTRTVRSVRQ